MLKIFLIADKISTLLSKRIHQNNSEILRRKLFVHSYPKKKHQGQERQCMCKFVPK